jgi:hypothetical protein
MPPQLVYHCTNASGRLGIISSGELCAVCCCEFGDLLSQWRAYGGDDGYAIAFRTEWLSDVSASHEEFHFAKIIYGPDNASPRLDTMVDELAKPVAGFRDLQEMYPSWGMFYRQSRQ